MELPEREPCPLCELVERGTWTLDGVQVESAVLARRELSLSFLKDDRADGYLFVIPKRHARTILELEPEEAADVMRLLVDVCQAVDRELNPDGINVLQNNGVLGHQAVPHVHFHVIPRRAGDGWMPPAGQVWTGQPAPLSERLAMARRLGERVATR